jgi:hypothetical protein
MTTKKNQNEVKTADAVGDKMLYVGKVSAAELAALRQKHGVVTTIKVEVSENETSVAYYKEPGREVKAKAMSLYMDKKIVETGTLIIKNCFLAGDKRQQEEVEHEEINLAAAVVINQNITFLAASLEK